MTSWLQQLSDVQATLSGQQQGIMVTVARVRGSAPREAGAKMWITDNVTTGTIGGGELEYQCQHIARDLLNGSSQFTAKVQNFPLGSNCGQCCGGVVDVLFESFSAQPATWQIQSAQALANGHGGYLTTIFRGKTPLKSFSNLEPGTSRDKLVERIMPSTTDIAVFGAGHVGSALVRILEQSSYQVVCIDSRPELLPLNAAANIQPSYQRQPATVVPTLAANTACVVMTHSHALDFDICASLLKRSDLSFYGLIGSRSKRQRFTRLFRQAGLNETQISRLTCPVGDTQINSKRPGDIAITIAAQILRQLETAQQTHPTDVSDAALHL
ncbi:MAG: xanthine dehydrogenase accessory protein XdhC [bacterium]